LIQQVITKATQLLAMRRAPKGTTPSLRPANTQRASSNMLNAVLACSLGAPLLVNTAYADSYVFITNSTAQPVTVSVKHSGNKGTLTPGSQWRQEATQIAPYATARVLAFNRNEGVKNGNTYYFDTEVKAGNQTFVARQQMTGKWIGSSIWHALQAPQVSAPWQQSRDIYRYQSQWTQQPVTVAMKAEFTGGYDDFYYTISNNTRPEPVAPASELKVLTYNIYALPLVASDIGERLAEIPAYVKGYDVLMLQEAFSSDSPAMLRALQSEYPYQTQILRKPLSGVNVYNGGVVIVSRYPIGRTDYVVYPDCTGTDCFADKGFIYAEIIKQGQAYHVVNTHAASFDTDAARQMRQAQFRMMQQHIAARQIPAGDAVLYGGDFNVNKLKFADDYQQMQQNLQAVVPMSTGYTASTFDPRVNKYAAKYDTVEYLDYVVWSRLHRQPTAARNDVRVPRSTSGALWGKWDLSDHFPVMGQFSFEAR
jgi:endonuclease/exonuclease/phosphatase family metal-dependent hydrolase